MFWNEYKIRSFVFWVIQENSDFLSNFKKTNKSMSIVMHDYDSYCNIKVYEKPISYYHLECGWLCWKYYSLFFCAWTFYLWYVG